MLRHGARGDADQPAAYAGSPECRAPEGSIQFNTAARGIAVDRAAADCVGLRYGSRQVFDGYYGYYGAGWGGRFVAAALDSVAGYDGPWVENNAHCGRPELDANKPIWHAAPVRMFTSFRASGGGKIDLATAAIFAVPGGAPVSPAAKT